MRVEAHRPATDGQRIKKVFDEHSKVKFVEAGDFFLAVVTNSDTSSPMLQQCNLFVRLMEVRHVRAQLRRRSATRDKSTKKKKKVVAMQ